MKTGIKNLSLITAILSIVNTISAQDKILNTRRSDKIIKKYQEQDPRLIRTTYEFEGIVKAPPSDVFPLLCPAREADWVPGWKADIIFSETGYAEDKCIFTTGGNTMKGTHGHAHQNKAIWVFTGYKPNEYVSLIKLEKNILTTLKITLHENKDGTTLTTWKHLYTALNKKGNDILTDTSKSYHNPGMAIQLLNGYFENKLDNSHSEEIVGAYKNSPVKLQRKNIEFSGKWNTTPEELFPLFCPAREADWLLGWKSKIIYSKTGFAEDKCVFTTSGNNSEGKGVWLFTAYEPNKQLEFTSFQENKVINACITVDEQKCGVTGATWHVTVTALNPKGNKEMEKMMKRLNNPDKPAPLVPMIDHYLTTGKRIGLFKLLKSL